MQALEKAWYSRARWPLLLWPVEGLYRLLARWDRARKRARCKPLPVPVLVVGNITVGGTGKSPLVAMLCQELKRQGWHPAVISRGYGGKRQGQPRAVTPDSDVREVGDEPVMLAAQTGCPLVVDCDRYRAAQALLDHDFFRQYFPGKPPCNLIISDDGLQHLALPRDLEWVVIDAERQLGNGHCLPVGPLRESERRLKTVDLVLANGAVQLQSIAGVDAQPMQLIPRYWRNLNTGDVFSAGEPPFRVSEREPAFAVAGIGHPERFFRTLENLGLNIERHPFPDHYDYGEDDLPADRIVLMTAKDAVKCRNRSENTFWALDIEACIAPDIIDRLHHQLMTISERKHHG